MFAAMVYAAAGGAGIPTWFLIVFIPLFIAGAIFSVLLFRRTGPRGAWNMMAGQSRYAPRAAIYIGVAGIVLSALLHTFWVAVVIVVPVILYGWWRAWGASGARSRTGR
jgi:Sec-independent protein secretion pathway component TatC